MVHFDIMVMSYLFDVTFMISIKYWNYSLKCISTLKQWIAYTHPIAYVHMLHTLQYLPTSHSEDSAMKLVIWYRYNICEALCNEL